jgi:hypothetical protein
MRSRPQLSMQVARVPGSGLEQLIDWGEVGNARALINRQRPGEKRVPGRQALRHAEGGGAASRPATGASFWRALRSPGAMSTAAALLARGRMSPAARPRSDRARGRQSSTRGSAARGGCGAASRLLHLLAARW